MFKVPDLEMVRIKENDNFEEAKQKIIYNGVYHILFLKFLGEDLTNTKNNIDYYYKEFLICCEKLPNLKKYLLCYICMCKNKYCETVNVGVTSPSDEDILMFNNCSQCMTSKLCLTASVISDNKTDIKTDNKSDNKTDNKRKNKRDNNKKRNKRK